MTGQTAEDERLHRIAEHIKAIIKEIGEVPERQGLLKTPERAAKALLYATSGYTQDAAAILRQALFDTDGSGIVVLRDIEFYSMCEHHMLPFFGKVSIGYIPSDKIVGISKIARMVNVYARRLQVQERFTAQLAEALLKALDAKGVIVRCSGEHMCMKMRGVEKQGVSTLTEKSNGVFAEDASLRAEFYSLLAK